MRRTRELRQRYAFSLANYWDLERPEMNPFFNFVAAVDRSPGRITDAYRTYDLAPTGNWLDESIDAFEAPAARPRRLGAPEQQAPRHRPPPRAQPQR